MSRRLRGIACPAAGAEERVLLGGSLAAPRGHHRIGDEAGIGADRALDRIGDFGIVLEILLGVLAALADALAVIGEPGAGFLDHAGLDTEIDEFAALGDAFA